MCDNWATTVIHRVGSMRPRLQELALEMGELCRAHGISIEWVWQSRKSEEVREADFLSKDYNFSDFYLSTVDFQGLKDEFGPFSCDFFASGFTHRMQPFMSRYKCEGSSGVDAFTAVWSGNGFFHPPVSRIVETVWYAKVQGAKGVLVTPYWQGSAFWAFLEKEKGVVERRRFRPLLRAPRFFRNKTFVGRPKFDFAVFTMDFRQRTSVLH